MKNFISFLFLSLGFVLKLNDCSVSSNSENDSTENINVESDISIFQKMSEGLLVPIAYKSASFEGAKRTLAMIILASFTQRNSYFRDQLNFAYGEYNEHFKNLADQSITIDFYYPQWVRMFLLKNNLFEFILLQGQVSLVDQILEEIENLAGELCPEKAKGIADFMILFPTLGRCYSEDNSRWYPEMYKIFEMVDSEDRILLFSEIYRMFVEQIENPLYLDDEFDLRFKNDREKLQTFLYKCKELNYEGIELVSPEYENYHETELNYFDELVLFLLDTKNSNTTSFFNDGSNSALMEKFLYSKRWVFMKSELKVLQTKGLFFLLSSEYNNEYVQNILKILDSRFRRRMWVSNRIRIDPNHSKAFWASLSVLKVIKEVDFLILILLRYFFDPHFPCREGLEVSCKLFKPKLNLKDDSVAYCKKFYSNMKKHDEAVIYAIFQNPNYLEALNEWQIFLKGFISPNFLYSGDATLFLREIGLQNEQLLWCIVGHALYLTFFKREAFSKVFRDILSKVPQETFVLKEEFLKISIMDSFTEVYAKLRETGNNNPIEFFFQYAAHYFDSSERLKYFFMQIPYELKFSSKEWDRRAESLNLSESVGKFTPEVADNILFIIANAYFEKKVEQYEKWASYLFSLDLEVLKFAVELMRKLDKSFFNSMITVDVMKKSPKNLYKVLKNLPPVNFQHCYT
jgi:hypothetical protein